MMQDKLSQLGLTTENAIVIGSGILQALNIRSSNDIDIVVSTNEFDRLRKTGRFKESTSYGLPVLNLEPFEIRNAWGVLGRDRGFADLSQDSTVLGGVRYISLKFLLAVKRSWLQSGEARDKDVADVRLIETYLRRH